MLETLAGPVPVAEGLASRCSRCAAGLQADEVALLTSADGGRPPRWRALRRPGGADRRPARADGSLAGDALAAAAAADRRGLAGPRGSRRAPAGRWHLAVTFAAPGGPAVLLASWRRAPPTAEATALMEDAAHSLRLALEREEAGARAPGGRGAAPVAGAAARLPVPAQPRAAHAADRDPRLRLQPAAARRDLGRASPSTGSWTGSPPSRPGSAGWWTTCSTSPRSSPASCGCSADWCDIQLVLEAAVACLPPERAARSTWLRRRPARDLGRP